MADKKEISLLVDNLRMPMMIGIVFIHTHFFKYIDAQTLQSLSAYNAVSYIITDLICQLFVPAFFIIAGYFFFKEKQLTPELYRTKLTKRFFSLVVPFLFWNALMLMIMLVQEKYLGATSSRMGTMTDYSFSDWLYAFFDDNRSSTIYDNPGQPASVQFWFIRDLILICLISPLIYWIVRTNKYLSLVLLIVIYFLPWHIPHLNNLSITYFGIGVWLQIYDIDFIGCAKKGLWGLLLISLIGMTGNYFAEQNDILYAIKACRIVFILSGLLVVVAIVCHLQQKRGHLLPSYIEQSSFFVFAYHIVPTAILCQLACRLLPHNSLCLIIAYLTIPFVITAIGVAISIFLHRFMPRFTAIITGGR